VLVFIVSQHTSVAQILNQSSELSNSTYNFFGLGERLFYGNAESMTMGGVSHAYVSQFNNNFFNPASAYQQSLTSFQAGAKISRVEQSYDTASQKFNLGRFAYANFSFPITRYLTSTIGAMPYYSKNYNVEVLNVPTTFGLSDYTFSSKGNINKIYLSNGFNPFIPLNVKGYNNFSLGLQVVYNFGSFDSQRYLKFQNTSTGIYNTNIVDTLRLWGFDYAIGIQNKFKVSKHHSFSYGISFRPSSSLTQENTYYANLSQKLGSSSINVSDFRVDTTRLVTPNIFHAGVGYYLDSNLFVGVDYRYEPWKNQFSNWNTFSSFHVGAEYFLNKTKSNFFEATLYRIGYRRTNLGIMALGQPLIEDAISFGFVFPLLKSFSKLNLAFELSRRGNKLANLQENYGSIILGLTVNDRWFIKRKYD
jgi:hypothetical protein